MSKIPIIIDEKAIRVGPITVPLSEFHYRYATSSGPGGQNVNRVNTKVYLSWDLESSDAVSEEIKIRLRQKYRRRISQEGVLRVISQRFRDQHKNKGDCHQKLAELLLSVLTVPKPRKKTKPSRAANQRRLENKRLHSQKKQNRRTPKQEL